MPLLKLQFQNPLHINNLYIFKYMIYIATSTGIAKSFYMVFLIKVIIPDTRDLFIGFEKIYCYGYRLNNNFSSLECIYCSLLQFSQ